jgi:chromosome segregation ATPase
MMKQRVRQAPSAGGLLTKNTAKLRTPKKTTKTAKTNLKQRPSDDQNLEWDSGKLRLEMLSPQIVRQAKSAKSAAGDAPKTTSGITTDLEHLAEKIQVAKKLNQDIPQETISDGLKQTMAELSYEGNKLADQLRNIQTGENRRVDNLENTISDLKLELDAAKSASFIHPHVIAPPLVERQIQVDIANDLITTFKSENAGLRLQLNESQGLILKLKTALQTQETTITSQTGKITDLKLSNSKSTQNFENEAELRLKLKNEFNKKAAELDRYMTRVKRLESQQKLLGKGNTELAHVQAALGRASAENVAANDEIHRLRLEITQSSSSIEGNVREKIQLESELAKLAPKLRAFEEQDKVIRVLESRLHDQTITSDQLRARLESLDHGKLARISELEHQLATFEVELARKKRSGLDKELKLEKSVNDLNLLKTCSQKELSEAKSEAHIAKEENAGLSEKLEAMSVKFDDMKVRFDALVSESEKKDGRINELTAEFAYNSAELQTVQSLATKSSEQLLKIQHQCNDAIGMKTAAERQLELACSEIRKAEDRQTQIRDSHKSEMAKTSANLQGQLSKLNAEIQSGREEIKEIERRNRTHVDELERKFRQSEQMNHSLQEYVNYLKSMSDQLTFR